MKILRHTMWILAAAVSFAQAPAGQEPVRPNQPAVPTQSEPAGQFPQSGADHTRPGVAADPGSRTTNQSGRPEDATKHTGKRGGAMTADQQGNSKADMEVTRNIRKELTKNDSLSVSAKNVKVITRDGMVYLRGNVKSEEEKQAIEAAAKQIAGDAKVENNLMVSADKSDKHEKHDK